MLCTVQDLNTGICIKLSVPKFLYDQCEFRELRDWLGLATVPETSIGEP
jgi:hypothetical protein